jgi:hypothetical protein
VGLIYNFKSSEPQNPQKAQKNIIRVVRAIRMLKVTPLFIPGASLPTATADCYCAAPGGGLTYNFKSSEPQNPQKTQK